MLYAKSRCQIASQKKKKKKKQQKKKKKKKKTQQKAANRKEMPQTKNATERSDISDAQKMQQSANRAIDARQIAAINTQQKNKRNLKKQKGKKKG